MASLCMHRRLAGSIPSFTGSARSQPRLSSTPLVARAKLTRQQKSERLELQNRESPFGTPVVDFLLETSAYSQFLDKNDVDDLRNRERNIAHIEDIGERLRRLRIAIANKKRQPWNVGKKHSPETIKKIRDSVQKHVHDPAAIEERKRRVAAWQNSDPEKVSAARARASESLRARWGVQLHKRYGFRNGQVSQTAKGQRVPTSAAAFFHIHRGCSASIMIHHKTWRREITWDKRVKRKKRQAPRKPLNLTEEEQEKRAFQTRLRKSEAQRRLWQDPEYRQRQVESIRAANGDPTVARKRATAKSISQLRRARDSTRQQLMEAEQLVPKLKALVENLQKEEATEAGSFELERKVQSTLQNSMNTLESARSTLSALRAEHASLDASLADAIKARDESPVGKPEGVEKPAAGNSASSNGAAPQPSTESDRTPATSNGVKPEKSDGAWPTAEQVKASGSAWNGDATGANDGKKPVARDGRSHLLPHQMRGKFQHPDFDVSLNSEQNRFNGGEALPRSWQTASSSESLTPHSPRYVNVRNGAGKIFIADESEDASDSPSSPPAQDEAASEPPSTGEVVVAHVIGFGGVGHELPAQEAPHSEPYNSHESENGNVLKNGSAADEGKNAGSVGAGASKGAGAGASEDLAAAEAQATSADAGSDEDEDGSWLTKRKHRLPWQ